MDGSNKSLLEFLIKCEKYELFYVIKFLKSHFCLESKEMLKKYPNTDLVPHQNTNERKKIAEKILSILTWYGSNSIAYGYRKILKKEGGVDYYSIVQDVAKILNNSLSKKERKKIPRVATVSELEELITEILLTKAKDNLKEKTPSEIAKMFMEAGLEKEAAEKATKVYGMGSIGVTLPMLTKALGKRTVKALIENTIINITKKRLGNDAAKLLAKRLLLKLPQKTIIKTINLIGWIWLSVDIICFSTSPARRITMPTIAFISAMRVRDKMVDN